MEAERRAWEAEDRGRGNLYYGEDLAAAMHWRFFVGKQVPEAWRALAGGLAFLQANGRICSDRPAQRRGICFERPDPARFRP